jgi:hypothetical protein
VTWRSASTSERADRAQEGTADACDELDADRILIYNTFVPGGTWLRPRGILTARLFRISAEFNF